MTDEVSSLMASGLGIDVFGDDVEMSRLDDGCDDGLCTVLGLPALSIRDVIAGCG